MIKKSNLAPLRLMAFAQVMKNVQSFLKEIKIRTKKRYYYLYCRKYKFLFYCTFYITTSV